MPEPDSDPAKYSNWAVTKAQLIEILDDADACLHLVAIGAVDDLLHIGGGVFVVRMRLRDGITGRDLAIYGRKYRLLSSDVPPDDDAAKRPMR